MIVNELTVASKEQSIMIGDGYRVDILFDMIYKRWFYNLYKDGELLFAGISLTPDTAGLLHICPSSVIILDVANDKEDYEPCNELGSRLALLEVLE